MLRSLLFDVLGRAHRPRPCSVAPTALLGGPCRSGMKLTLLLLLGSLRALLRRRSSSIGPGPCARALSPATSARTS
eukprot:6896786-Alexandrium_andersonii.AAC.1